MEQIFGAIRCCLNLNLGDEPAFNQLILDERNYNRESLKTKHDKDANYGTEEGI